MRRLAENACPVNHGTRYCDCAGLKDCVRVAQWDAINHNGNDLVCMKRRPMTPGNPAYLFNGVDDQSSSPVGGAGA